MKMAPGTANMAPDIAHTGTLVGDPVRAAMLAVLIDGRALPAGDLAFVGNVAPQTASFHLAKLRQAGLISLERQGKHKYYRLANEEVAAALESLAAIAPVRNQAEEILQSRRESDQAAELRFARSCYKHLAGRLAVEIHQRLLKSGLLLAKPRKEYCLTDDGYQWCRELGLPLLESTSSRSHTGRACLDWTERHHHLGGRLGVALFSRLKEIGWLAQKPGTRAVRLTHTGRQQLKDRLQLEVQ